MELPLPLLCRGVVDGCCSVSELLLELFELVPEFESEELDESAELDELLSPELSELDDPDFAALDVLLSDEVPLVTDACVEPGSTATTTPAATTEANETVIVVAFSRRLPCSRSATACASLRAAALLAFRRARARSRSFSSGSSQAFMSLSLTCAPVPTLEEQSQQAMNQSGRCAVPRLLRLPRRLTLYFP